MVDAFQWASGDASVAGALWPRWTGESYRRAALGGAGVLGCHGRDT